MDIKKKILRYDEIKQTSSFATNVQRSIMNLVSKDLHTNPGPGDYIVEGENSGSPNESKMEKLSVPRPAVTSNSNTKIRIQRSIDKGIIDQDHLADNLSNIGIFKKKTN